MRWASLIGQEHHLRTWSEGHWGLVARPILERIRDGRYKHDYLPGLAVGSRPEKGSKRAAESQAWAWFRSTIALPYFVTPRSRLGLLQGSYAAGALHFGRAAAHDDEVLKALEQLAAA